jgi:hypothetical protein
MEDYLKLVPQFLAESNIKASDFYSISFNRSRITMQGNFDTSVGLSASKYGDGILTSDSGYVEFYFTYYGANINITLT